VSAIHAAIRTELGAFLLDVQLDIPGKGVTAIFGPSGSGKTTLLRYIAGLERAGEVSIRHGEEPWQDSVQGKFVPPHKRRVGYIFQDATLFPHLTVLGNVRYGYRRTPAGSRRFEMAQAIEWLGLTPLLGRWPTALSGGERQRVAMARALVTSPAVLLMDEPLSALDEGARMEIVPYLQRLQRELAIPVVYVSHSVREVALLADHVVLLRAGKVADTGTATAMLERIAMLPELGEERAALFEVVVLRHEAEFELSAVAGPFGEMYLPRVQAGVGERVRIRVAARDVSLGLVSEERSSILNELPCRVIDLTRLSGGQMLVRLAPRGEKEEAHLLSLITWKSAEVLGIHAGLEVFARVKGVSLAQ